MNTLGRVRRHVQDLPESQPIVAKNLYHLGQPEDVDAALATLVGEGILLREAEGVFGKPIHSEFGIHVGFGSWEIAKAICEADGHALGVTPAEWANRVHLSTQMVVVPSYITDGPTREIPWGQHGKIYFAHASDRDIRLSQSLGGGALLGLEWEHPQFPYVAVKSLFKLLRQDDFQVFLTEAGATGGWVAHVAKVFEDAHVEAGVAKEPDANSREAPQGLFEFDPKTLNGIIDRAFCHAFQENEARRDERLRALEKELVFRKEAETIPVSIPTRTDVSPLPVPPQAGVLMDRAGMKPEHHRPECIAIAGPNGSGKTTFAREFLTFLKSRFPDLVHVNPDDIAATEFPGKPYGEVVFEAAQIAQERRERALEEKRNLVFETVFSAPEKVGFLQRAKAAGYFVRLFFIGTEDAAINCARVAFRVANGGHAVPIEKIMARHPKSIANAAMALTFVDRGYVLDNSADGHWVPYEGDGTGGFVLPGVVFETVGGLVSRINFSTSNGNDCPWVWADVVLGAVAAHGISMRPLNPEDPATALPDAPLD